MARCSACNGHKSSPEVLANVPNPAQHRSAWGGLPNRPMARRADARLPRRCREAASPQDRSDSQHPGHDLWLIRNQQVLGSNPSVGSSQVCPLFPGFKPASGRLAIIGLAFHRSGFGPRRSSLNEPSSADWSLLRPSALPHLPAGKRPATIVS